LVGVPAQNIDDLMSTSPMVVLAALLAGAFTLSTCLLPRAQAWTQGSDSDQLVQVLLGDGRKILANQMFVEADVYFHSGYYPSVFDQAHAPTNSQHMAHSEAADAGPGHEARHDDHDEKEHEATMNYLGQPRDWIECFGRKFAITTHTHLAEGKQREILPWLRLSAELDPHRVQTYTVAGYWLRRTLGKPKEAEEFLREGLNANPSSYEILNELGWLYSQNFHDMLRARNVWRAALQRWLKSEEDKPKPDLPSLGQITDGLANAEETDGRLAETIEVLKFAIAHDASPHPEALEAHIKNLQAKIAKQGTNLPATSR
jgi:tetratricopeptide (TPR) repeat protein